MSFAELQQYYSTPYQNTGTYTRRINKLLVKLRAKAKYKIRRETVKIKTSARRQYYPTNAYGDMRAAAAKNEDIFIMSMASIVVLGFAAAVTAAEIFLNFFMTAFILSETLNINLIFISAGAVSALLVLCGWYWAFLINLMSISLMEGTTRKTVKSVRLTFKKSLSSATRVATIWLAFLTLLVIPLAAVTAVGLLYLQLFAVTMSQLFALIQYGTIGAIIWLVYVLLQYSLTPYVCLFEPMRNYKSCFERSKQLVQRKGRIFILTCYCFLAAALAGAYAISSFMADAASFNKWLLFISMLVPTVLVFNGAMVMFYRKRRLARKY